MDMSTLKSRLQAIAQGLGLHRHSSSSSMDRSGQQQQQHRNSMPQDPSQGSTSHVSDLSQQQMSEQQNASWSGGMNQQMPQQGMNHPGQVGSAHDTSSQHGGLGSQGGMAQQQQLMQGGMDVVPGQLSHHSSMSNMSASGQQQQQQGNTWAAMGQGNTMGQSPVQSMMSASDDDNNNATFGQMNQMQLQSGSFGNMGGQQQPSSLPVDQGQQMGMGVAPSPTAMSGESDNNSQTDSNWMQDPASIQKKRVIRQQQERLLLLRHASKCRLGPSCSTKFCSQMVTLWRHMRTCRDKNCRTSHCLSSRCVLNHYRICKSNGQTATCEVCGPVMARIKQLERDDGSTDPLTMSRDSDSSAQQSGMIAQSQGAANDAAQLQQNQQMKLQQRIENLQQLQKQQNQLLEQQRRLQEQAHNITDPNSQQAVQLQQQQILLSKLQQRCQQQQLVLQNELREQANLAGMNQMQSQSQMQQAVGQGNNTQGLQQQGMPGSTLMQQGLNNPMMQQQASQTMQSSNQGMPQPPAMPQGIQGMMTMQTNGQGMQQQCLPQGMQGIAGMQSQVSQSMQGMQAMQGVASMQNVQSMQQQAQPMPNHPSLQQPQSAQSMQAIQSMQQNQQGIQSIQSQVADNTQLLQGMQGMQSQDSVPSSDALDMPKKRRSRSDAKMPRAGGKGKRISGGKGKAISNILAVGEGIKPVKAKSSLAKKKAQIEADNAQSLEQEQDGQKDDVVLPPRPGVDTSLLSAMTKDEIAKHLESLNKGIRLSSRTVTHKCMPLIQELIDDQFGWVFHDAVDPVALGLPDYFDVVKNPMHLELVKKKLENAIYSTMDAFARDVKLVFENAILYNGESSEVGALAQSMLDKFDVSYNTLLQGL